MDRDNYESALLSQDDEDQPQGDELIVSRQALDEAYSALSGCKAVLGDIANISHAMDRLRTAQFSNGEYYEGHEPNFVVGGWSEPPPIDLSKYPEVEVSSGPRLGLASNAELAQELRVREKLGHTNPNYKTVGYDGPLGAE
jgi:hypothetical protein